MKTQIVDDVTFKIGNCAQENWDLLSEAHPEYYSLIDGVRRPGTQLCLSNPEVLQVLIASLKVKIAEKDIVDNFIIIAF